MQGKILCALDAVVVAASGAPHMPAANRLQTLGAAKMLFQTCFLSEFCC